MDENSRHFSAFTVQDCRRLQVLQNKVLRLKTGLNFETPTLTLLKTANDMSVHQLIAYKTILTVHKTMQTKKPSYIYNKIKPRQNERPLRNDNNLDIHNVLLY